MKHPRAGKVIDTHSTRKQPHQDVLKVQAKQWLTKQIKAIKKISRGNCAQTTKWKVFDVASECYASDAWWTRKNEPKRVTYRTINCAAHVIAIIQQLHFSASSYRKTFSNGKTLPLFTSKYHFRSLYLVGCPAEFIRIESMSLHETNFDTNSNSNYHVKRITTYRMAVAGAKGARQLLAVVTF